MITPRFKRRSSERNPRTQAPSRSPSASAQAVQVLSVVGLLATVFFTYMSWRESRLAREDQAAYFIAEKVPQLELVEVHSVMGTILTLFKNVGESVARNVVASATPHQFGIGEAEASPDRPDQSLPAIVVQKGQSSQVPVNTSPKVRGVLGMKYGNLVRTDLEVVKAPRSHFILLKLEYQDVRQNNYVQTYSLVLKTE